MSQVKGAYLLGHELSSTIQLRQQSNTPARGGSA